MTLGWGERTIAGVWVDKRERRWVINLLGFGWHYQAVLLVTVNRWRR